LAEDNVEEQVELAKANVENGGDASEKTEKSPQGGRKFAQLSTETT
jgi:2-keto-3-deoxy-6-phosphogluconate aldolase